MRLLGLILCSSLLAVASAQFNQIAPVSAICNSGNAGTLSANGNGLQSAVADQATVSLKISVNNFTANGARLVAGNYADQVIYAVRNISGISPQNVTTTSITVDPNTHYNSDTGDSTINGYTFTNSIQVKMSNVTNTLLSQVLDTAVANGGNNLTIDSVSFSLSDALSYNKTVAARAQAAQDAYTTASAYAKALGVTLGSVLTIQDQTYNATPLQTTAYSRSASAYSDSGAGYSKYGQSTTAVSIGSQDVTASVQVTYTVCSQAGN